MRVRGIAADCLFLAVATVLSFVWYAPRLGFYSDDWAFLGRYATAAEQSVEGFYNATMSSQHAMRPVQVWLCALLYALFGWEPLGYHLFNGALLTLNVVLVYLIGRHLGGDRTIAVAAALTYALLPNYSTDRVWYLAFAIVLSMTGCLTSVYAALKAIHASPRVAIVWSSVSAIALLVSALSYEVALPLYLLLPLLLLWHASPGDSGSKRPLVTAGALVMVHAALLTAVVAFKLQTTVRLGAHGGVLAQIGDIARHAVRRDLPDGHYGLNIFSAVRVHFGDYAVRLPVIAWELLASTPAAEIALTGIFALTAMGFLARVAHRREWPPPRQWVGLLLGGVVVFWLGYAIFLTNYNVQFTPTGIANRSAIAAALGAAMVIVGGIGLTLTSLPSRAAATGFAVLVSLVATCGFIIIHSVARHWAEAYAVERRVLDDIQRRFPSLPSNSTLILDGVCPYVGPAVVFESHWDLAGALQVTYRDQTLLADVVTRRLAVTRAGIMTTIYDVTTVYPYGERLVVFNVASGVATPLPDLDSARQYFASTDHERCPVSREGIGVRIF